MLANVASVTDYVMTMTSGKLPREFVKDVSRETYSIIERYHTWDHRKVEGQITAVADYTTGTVEVTQGSKNVTFSGATLTAAMITRHFQVSSGSVGGRWYEFASINTGAGTAVLVDPYEDADATDVTYVIRQRYYRYPPDFARSDVAKETAGMKVVWWRNRAEFEQVWPSIESTGQVYHLVPAGTSRTVLYNTGTVTLTNASTTVTGAGTSWLAARDEGRRIRFPLYPKLGDFTVQQVNSTTELLLDRAWPVDTVGAQIYQIDPIGEELVEPFPSPSDGNSSVRFFYYKVPPPLFLETDTPIWKAELSEVWKAVTLLYCTNSDPIARAQMLGQIMGNFMKSQGFEANQIVPSRAWGCGPQSPGSNLPWNFAPYRIIG